MYEAATVVAIETRGNEVADTSHRLAAIQSQLTARARIEAISNKLGLFDEAASASKDERIAAMQSNIRLSEYGTNGLRISYRAADAKTAAALANALASTVALVVLSGVKLYWT